MSKLTKILLLVAGLAVLVCGAVIALGDYSEGVRMGQLVKYSSKGMVIKTGEGELQIGRDSARTASDASDSLEENPWRFSSSKEVYAASENLIGQYVAIDYHQPQFTVGSLTGDTGYRAIDIKPLSGSPTACVIDPGRGWKSNGVRVGRIVKVSTKGTLIKTNEVAIQVGDAGNQFIDMSTPDDEMFACAGLFLRSGLKVRVSYRQDYIVNPLSQSTTYTITGIYPEK